MRYCTRCLYPENHPFGLTFDEAGVCSGCRVHEEKDELDWGMRGRKLERILASHRSSSGNSFDCIVPVTGGGDSYFIVHTLKTVHGLNPLLVHYNHQYNTPRGIRNLGNLASALDCDVLTYTLDPEFLRRLTRHTLRQHGSMYWHCLAGYLTFPVQAAVKFKTPLVIWGTHPWADQNGMFSHLDEAEMTEKCRKEHSLLGLSAEDMVSAQAGISRRDMQPFVYPYENEIERVGVRGIYLGNYMRWDSKSQHEEMIKLYGYETAPQQRTFNTYEDVHCFHSAGLHDWLKFLRLGYSKVTDHASREIRLKRMTREEGIDMVARYGDTEPADLPHFLDWIGMSRDEFMACVDHRRSQQVWEKTASGWQLKDSIINHRNDAGVDAARLEKIGDCYFQVTPSMEPDNPDQSYILMGRGYIDRLNYGALEDRVEGGGLTPRSIFPPAPKRAS